MDSRLMLLVIALIITLTVAVILLALPHFKPVSHAANAVGTVGFTVANVSLNVPIYVVGPSLVNRLVGVGVNVSLIRLVNISRLPLLPNGSVVIVYWPIIRPSLIAYDSGGVVTVNLTSPVVGYLAGAIARGDIVGIYANGSVEGIIDFILAYSWAVASNNRLLFSLNQPTEYYLLAYPTIPVNTHEAVVFVAKWVKPRGLVIGPVYLNQLTAVIANIMKSTTVVTIASSSAKDPCYEAYSYYSLSKPPGIIVANDYTFIWAAPMFYSTPYATYGIQAYSDGNGTYYWDTCLTAFNYVFGNVTVTSGFPINVIGYEDYLESPTMANNFGLEGYQVGAIDYYTGYQMYSSGETNALVGDVGGGEFSQSSWNPPPASGIAGYEIQGVIPFIGVAITLPSGTSESISTSQNPSYVTNLPNVPVIEVSNITWTFNIYSSASNGGFPNAFEDITPAAVFLQGLSIISTAAFPIDFENYAVTFQFACAYYTDQTIWVNAMWIISIVLQWNNVVNLTQPYLDTYLSSSTPPGTYITGISSKTIPTPCLVLS